eukprot:4411726-Pleurochrysis_carterae.AAC.2
MDDVDCMVRAKQLKMRLNVVCIVPSKCMEEFIAVARVNEEGVDSSVRDLPKLHIEGVSYSLYFIRMPSGLRQKQH